MAPPLLFDVESITTPVEPIWVDNDYFSHIMPVLTAQYIIFTLISRVIHRVLCRLHQTRFVSNMLTAVIMGPTFIGSNKYISSKLLYPHLHYLTLPREALSDLGIILYVFLAAVKVDSMYSISRVGKKALKVGVTSAVVAMVAVLGCTLCIRIYINQDVLTYFGCVVVSLHLCFGSSANIVATLSELGLMSSEGDRFAVATMVVTDMVVWVTMAILILLNKGYIIVFIGLLLFEVLSVMLCVWVLRPFTMRVIRRLPNATCDELSVVVVSFILGAMVMQTVSDIVTTRPLIGPILFGLFIPSGPPLGSSLVKKASLVAEEILLPFLYIQLGSHLCLHKMMEGRVFFFTLAITFMGFFIKFVMAMVCSKLLCGFNTHDSRSIALMLNFGGVVTVYLFDKYRQKNVINEQFSNSLIISSLIIHAILSPLVKILHQMNTNKQAAEAAAKEDTPPNYSNQDENTSITKSLQQSRNDAEFRVITCVYDVSNVSLITHLLEISNRTVKTVSCSVCAYVIHIAELDVGQTAPLFGPHFNHTRICHYNGCDHILTAFNNYTRFSKEQVIVMPFTSISPYSTMHHEICRLAKDKNIPLIILPYHKNNNTNSSSGLRTLYMKMQRHAMCTVGILVDKSTSIITPPPTFPLTKKCNPHHSKYNILIIFIGGADDREALAYGLRMLGHSNLTVTLLHIQMTEEWEMAYLDDDMQLVDEFKTRTETSNNNATYHDIIVEDWNKAIEAIKHRVTEDYELIIVGQRQGKTSMWLQEEMKEWMENPELGVVGDMLVSFDSSKSSRVSMVLVLHHHGHVDQPARIGERSELNRLSSKTHIESRILEF